MQERDGLVCAFDLDGKGGGRPLAWDHLAAPPGGVVRWIHFDRSSPRAQRWLADKSGLDEIAQRALLAVDTRPRCTVFDDGLLLILRGVNLNPGADPEDMISLRLWITPERVVSARRFPIMAVRDIAKELETGRGPVGIGAFVARLATGLTERMETAIDTLEEELSDLEEEMLERPEMKLRRRLGEVRRRAITLRRYIACQREALSTLATVRPAWLEEEDRERLSEQVDRVTRYVEELDALRERGYVLQDELVTQLSDRMNRIVFVLTVITGIFLPITFLTGLLGINVGGMPGVESDWAFWIVCSVAALIVAVELAWLRFLKWL